MLSIVIYIITKSAIEVSIKSNLPSKQDSLCFNYECILVKMSNKLSGDEKSNFDKWTIPATKYSKLTLNKIRDIAEYMKYDPKTNKELIRLSVGKIFKFDYNSSVLK